MEALFCFRQQFFCLMAAKIQGQPQKPRQLPGHIGPEFPQGPQQRRSRQQIQQHPRPGSQQQIQLRLAAVQAQLADVQPLSGDDQGPLAGGHDDAALVEPLHVLHPGHRQLVPALQLHPVIQLLPRFIRHKKTAPSYQQWNISIEYPMCMREREKEELTI